jgi:stage IV sporulation protein FB
LINLLGVSIRFHPLFIIILMTSVITGHFLELLTLFAIVFVHEMGHFIAAKGFGWRVREVRFLPFGGVAVVDDQGNIPASEDIAVALAGPLQNFLLAAFALVMEWTRIWSAEWVHYFIQSNLLIGLFNLLPVLPLDGGKIMQSVMSLWLPYHKAILITAWVSFILGAFIVVFALLPIASEGVHLNLLLLGMFLTYANWVDLRNIPFHFLRFLTHREKRAAKMMARGTLAQPIVVSGRERVYDIVRLFMRERYHLVFVINARGRVQAVLPEQRLIETILLHNRPRSLISDIL